VGLQAELARQGCDRFHDNIRLERLPRLFAAGRARKLIASLRGATPGLATVAGSEGVSFPGDDRCITMAELELLISATEVENYGLEIPTPHK
jgi:hypothetical protein